MRKQSVVILLVSMIAFTGCSESEDQTAKLTNAMDRIERIRLVAFNEESPAEYRREAFAEYEKIANDLEAIKTQGENSQKAAVRRILADINATRARYLSQQARKNWGTLVSDRIRLHNELSTVSSAQLRSHVFAPQGQQILQQLQQQKAQTQQELQAARSEAQQINSRIQEIQSQIEAQQQSASQLHEQAEQLRQQAFVEQDRQKQHELSLQAIEVDHKAESHTTKIMELRDVELARLQGQMELLNKRVELLNSSVEMLDSQHADVQSRDQGDARLVADSRQQQGDAESRLMTAFEGFKQAFQQQVDEPLRSAEMLFTQSIEDLEQAKGMIRGRQAATVDADILSIQIELANLLADHVHMLSGVGNTVALMQIRAQILMPQQADSLAGEYQSLITRQQELRSQFNKVAEGVVTSEQEVANRNSDMFAGLLAEVQKVRQTHARVDASMLPATPLSGENISATTPSSTGSPSGSVQLPDVQITGDIPALPDAAFAENVAALIVFDPRILSPVALDRALKDFLGPAAAEMGDGLSMMVMGYGQQYQQFAESGGVAVAFAFFAPQSPEGIDPNNGFFLIATKEGANTEALRDIFAQGPVEAGETVNHTQQGNWLILTREGMEPADSTHPDRGNMETALAKFQGQAVYGGLIMTDQMKTMAAENNPDEADALQNMQWAAFGINHATLRINIAAKMNSGDEAETARTALQKSLDEAYAPSDAQDDPMAGMMTGMLPPKTAFNFATNQDEVTIVIDGKQIGQSPMVGMFLGMMLMGGEMESPGGFDDFPAPAGEDPFGGEGFNFDDADTEDDMQDDEDFDK